MTPDTTKKSPFYKTPLFKKLAIAASLLLVIVIIGLIIHQVTSAPKQAEIANLNSFLRGKPNDSTTLTSIKRDLYNTIALNTTTDPSSLKDILVRSNSFSQEKTGNLYTNSFIVDIDSLKQSYHITYQWSDTGNDSNLPEWGSRITCLTEKSEIIYPEFNCQDFFTEQAGTNNPVATLLPHFVDSKYNLSAIIDQESVTGIKLEIYSCTSSADLYEQEARAWLSSQNIDLSTYPLTVVYCATY